jgi:signal transduction histidine kinase/DNA-binding response OmpR family regulator
MTAPTDDKIRVLVVDGTEGGFEAVAKELRKAPGRYDIRRAASRDGLAAALKEHAPDAVICDHGVFSSQAAAWLEAVSKERPAAPLIIISGTAGEESAVEALRSGAADYLLKDRLSRLVPALERAMLEARERFELGRAQEALGKSQAQLKMLFDNMAEGVSLNELVFDGAGRAVNYRIIDVNRQFERMTGIGRDSAAGALATEAYGSEAPPLLDMFAKVVSGGVSARIEFFYSPLARHFDVSASRWGRSGFAVIFSDITERKKIEQALRESEGCIKKAYRQLQDAQQKLIQSEKMAAVGRFASGIAHEVKNPLGIILSGAELLQMKFPRADADVASTLEKIKEASLRANFVLQSLLQFARPSRLDIAPVRPEDIVTPVVEMMSSRAQFAGIKIGADFSGGVTDVPADKAQMQQVVFNIVKNALEAVEKGGSVKIRVYAEESAGPAGAAKECVIEVADSGHGISEADRLKVAEPFFSTRPEGKGTGLGLFVSKTIIENHGGRLVIESRPGRGTKVKIILPLPGKERA